MNGNLERDSCISAIQLTDSKLITSSGETTSASFKEFPLFKLQNGVPEVEKEEEITFELLLHIFVRDN
jgi:hypothetical protein